MVRQRAPQVIKASNSSSTAAHNDEECFKDFYDIFGWLPVLECLFCARDIKTAFQDDCSENQSIFRQQLAPSSRSFYEES